MEHRWVKLPVVGDWVDVVCWNCEEHYKAYGWQIAAGVKPSMPIGGECRAVRPATTGAQSK